MSSISTSHKTTKYISEATMTTVNTKYPTAETESPTSYRTASETESPTSIENNSEATVVSVTTETSSEPTFMPSTTKVSTLETIYDSTSTSAETTPQVSITDTSTEIPTEVVSTESPVTQFSTTSENTAPPVTNSSISDSTTTSSATSNSFTPDISSESTSNPTTMPPSECEADGLYPNTDDCKTFFECVSGTRFLRTCPGQLHFNAATKVCDSPCIAKCDLTLDCPETTTGLPVCQDPYGFYPNPSDCATFYKCFNGSAIFSRCVGDQHFSPIHLRCEDPCEAKCDLSLICPTTRPTTLSTASPICTINDGYVPNLQDCSSFYYCQEGQPQLMNCPDGLHFSRFTRHCEFPCNANCDSSLDCLSTRKITETTPVTPTSSAQCLEPEGLYPIKEECTKFVNCSRGLQSTANCPEDLYFNPTMRVCDWPATADCGNDPQPLTKPDHKHYCDCQFCLKPYSADCSKYYLCVNQTAYLLQCSSGLLFDPDLKTCNHERETTCQTATDTTTSATSTQKPFMCKEKNALYKNPEDCKTFYHCSNWIAYLKPCPANLHFSEKTQRCEYPCDAKCDNTLDCPTEQRTTVTTPLTPTSSVRCLFPQGLEAVKEDCTKFANCSGDSPRIEDCPEGLHFNPTKRACDWPSSSQCGQEPQPLTNPDKEFNCECEFCIKPQTTDCSQYHLCINHTAYLLQCSKGLLFDPDAKTCTYAKNVNCQVNATTAPVTSSTTPKAAFRCRNANGLYQNPDDCKMFYQCSNWTPYLMTCPSDLHFSERTKHCEYPCVAECDKTLVCPSYKEICVCQDCLLPNPSDCSLYYECRRGKANRKRCRHGQLFDAAKKKCNWANLVECGTTTKPSTTTQDPICSCYNCVLPSSVDCSQYYECRKGKASKRRCSRGKLFDDVQKKCNWAHLVNCSLGNLCPQRNGLFPYPPDCHKFVHCSNAIPYIKVCPSNLEFYPRNRRCEKPSGRCQTSGNSSAFVELKSGISSNASQFWKCPKRTGFFHYAEDCSKFYECIAGISHLKACPSPLLYNRKFRICDWPENVNCADDREDDHYHSHCIRANIRCPRNGSLVGHSSECGSFYDCSTGRACKKECPSGLHFNVQKMICDFPGNVNCQKSKKTVLASSQFLQNCQGKEGYIADYNNERCFYHCTNGQALRACCPSDLMFNPRTAECDWPWRAEQQTSSYNDDNRGKYRDQGFHCPPCTCNVPSPSNCSVYYSCRKREAFLLECPPGLYFNKNTATCDLPEKVKCASVSCKGNECCSQPNGDFSNVEDCQSFYRCSHGVASLQRCPSYLLFNPQHQVCDWPGAVQCKPGRDAFIPLTLDRGEKDVNGLCPGQCNCQVPDKDDCSAFYQCSGRYITKRKCPFGLLYNMELMMCDIPNKAKCATKKQPNQKKNWPRIIQDFLRKI